MISVFSEITDVTNRTGWVFYDGECPLCISLAKRFRPLLHSHGFALIPLQWAFARVKLGEVSTDIDAGMRVLTRDGVVRTGADAVVRLAEFIWWAFPLRIAARFPMGMPLLRRGYGWIAERRNCTHGACAIPAKHGQFAWLPLALLPLLAGFLTWNTPPWVFMWTVAASIFMGCKWLTWKRAGTGIGIRSLGYLLLWPGMNAREFLDAGLIPARPLPREWTYAALKTAGGAFLLWDVAGAVPPEQWLLRGWVGMIGMIFLLHFGAFHLLALAWRRAGVTATPIMNMPAAAQSPAEFWGARWNRGFSDLARNYLFRPLQRKFGIGTGMLFSFFASGLIHEALISLPAGGGYGLPTLYFTAQGAGILLQRSRFGKYLGLHRGFNGWIFTLLVTGIPAFWAFHPLFVHKVIIPFMQTIGAL